EREVAPLERAATRPYPRIDYGEAIERLQGEGVDVAWGDDFGADEETLLSRGSERPLMITRYPAQIKAFYMQPDPVDPRLVLALDMIAPDGYGEIVGGSERIHDVDLLRRRIEEHGLPEAN